MHKLKNRDLPTRSDILLDDLRKLLIRKTVVARKICNISYYEIVYREEPYPITHHCS